MLLAVCWLPLVARLHTELRRFVDAEASAYLAQLPPIEIRNGELSVDAPEPHTIVEPVHGKPVVVIDTTGEIASMDDTEAMVLATRDRITVRSSEIETRSFDLSDVDDFTVTRERVEGWIGRGLRLVVPVVYPSALAVSYVSRVVLALILALVGMLFASGRAVAIPFAGLVRMSVVAMTPSIVVRTLLSAAGVGG